MKILNSTTSLKHLESRLQQSEKVTFIRFGDNDIFQATGTNNNGNPLSKPLGGNKTVFTRSLQFELQETLKFRDDNFLLGMSGNYPKEEGMKKGLFAPFGYSEVLEAKIRSLTDQKVFLSPVLFHLLYCFNRGEFNRFFNTWIRDRKILFIGSVDRDIVEILTGRLTGYVSTPPRNSYAYIDEWWPEVMEKIKGCDVVLPATGQASRVVGGRLWHLGYNVHCIDVGSVWDCEAGNMTRTWIKMMQK